MMARRYFLILCAALLASACSAAVQNGAQTAEGGFRSDEISVVTRGSGADVILIHGLAGHVDVWAPAAQMLDDRYRLHLVQIHGFGGVPRSSTDSLVARAVAREVARYISETGLTRPSVIGHSMGGTIALMVAADHPALTGRVLVVDMIPFMGAMFELPDASPEALRPMADQMRAQLLNTDMLDQLVGTMTRGEANRQKLLEYAQASDRRTVAHAMHEIILTDMRPQLPRISVPLTVLYVQPTDVRLSTQQFDNVMKQMYGSAPNANLVRIEDSAHYIQLDQPARFVAAVDQFMRR